MGRGSVLELLSDTSSWGDKKQGEREFRSWGWGRAGCHPLDSTPQLKDMVSGITHTLSLIENQCKKLSSCRALQEKASKSLALVR